MLFLTRKDGEAIVMGDNVAVRVVGAQGEQVRMGVQAPGDVDVHYEQLAIRAREPLVRLPKTTAPLGISDAFGVRLLFAFVRASRRRPGRPHFHRPAFSGA